MTTIVNSDWLPAVRALPRAEKLRLIQMLAEELADEDKLPQLVTEVSYPIWSPLHADAAAEVLLQELAKQGAGS